MVASDGSVLEGAVHPFDLAVGPGQFHANSGVEQKLDYVIACRVSLSTKQGELDRSKRVAKKSRSSSAYAHKGLRKERQYEKASKETEEGCFFWAL
jgi:hypothetical protein